MDLRFGLFQVSWHFFTCEISLFSISFHAFWVDLSSWFSLTVLHASVNRSNSSISYSKSFKVLPMASHPSTFFFFAFKIHFISGGFITIYRFGWRFLRPSALTPCSPRKFPVEVSQSGDSHQGFAGLQRGAPRPWHLKILSAAYEREGLGPVKDLWAYGDLISIIRYLNLYSIWA